MSSTALEAAVFDLDGVITGTAKVHARAWKESFDIYLERWSKESGVRQPPFDEVDDYLAHVDGKPRENGVADFLVSRGIEPRPEAVDWICKDKNGRYLRLIEELGVDIFESSVRLIETLRAAGVPTAVASSSRNCAHILAAAKLSHLFDTRVDGNDLAELDLPGKPAPDLFLEAARRLEVDPARSVVFEDATSGVEAGARAGYAIVIGVAREDNADELRAAGAHRVVTDLAEIDPKELLEADFERLEQR